MKKALVLGIICLAAQTVFAQQTLKLSVKYLPMQNYATTYKMDMDMKMSIGDEATAQALKAAGQPSNMVMKMNMAMAVDMATQAINAKKEVPFTATYTDFAMNGSMNGQALPLPQTSIKGIGFLGHYSNDTKKLAVDGIKGDTTNAAAKASAQEQLSQIFNQYSFPEATLKVGESFEQNMPISLPVGAGSTEVMTKIKYTLKEIKANEAIFDLNQVLDMTMDLPQNAGKMTMNGTGKGSMIYNIAAAFPVRFAIDMDFGFKMNTAGTPISGNMKGVSLTEVKVTKK
ncbi:hypothetical protein ACFQZS_18370 [Mucilaginibacter calamicampi]|uniref:DUF3108 domain-containing protein n=1 Tax=Mucilaginibacter calamicampi TaxID=1302352 RepID=A0ABW2Z090_9SPHI